MREPCQPMDRDMKDILGRVRTRRFGGRTAGVGQAHSHRLNDGCHCEGKKVELGQLQLSIFKQRRLSVYLLELAVKRPARK
jgi:hypothetical protein